ncbi:response regulator [Anaerolineales bacterium]
MKKILVIEDSSDLREGIIEVLEIHGYHVYGAEDGAVGIEMIKVQPPDLILCDIMMPDVDGYQVFDFVRSNVKLALIPFVFLTSKTDRQDRRFAMAKGASDFVTKPFSVDELLQCVRHQLEKVQPVTRLVDSILLSLPHEFNTPLNHIINNAQLIMNMPQDERVEQYAEDIFVAGERLKNLVSKYLFFTWAELISRSALARENQLTLQTTDDPASVIEYRSDLVADEYGRSDDMNYQFAGTATLHMDPDHLGKIIHELVDNACKFSKPGQPIQIQTLVKDDQLLITICDQGQGMTDQQIHDIGVFIQFDRLINEQQGVGLGLAICQRLLRIYDGKMELKRSPKTGLSVFVEIPLVG